MSKSTEILTFRLRRSSTNFSHQTPWKVKIENGRKMENISRFKIFNGPVDTGVVGVLLHLENPNLFEARVFLSVSRLLYWRTSLIR